MSARHALVAGGGIAGLAAALALARQGWRVRVFERVAEPGEVGAGIQLSPNAVRALEALGVRDAAEAAGFAPRAAVLRDGRSGRVIYRAPLGEAAERRWGAPYLHLHRADLLALLLTAAKGAGVGIETGSAVRALDPARAALTLATGETVAGDLVLAADGMRSALRSAVAGPGAPVFSGLVAWRALVPAERLPAAALVPEAVVRAGPGRHLVSYLLRGGAVLNLVAVEERAEPVEADWQQRGDPAALRRAFHEFDAAARAMLEAVDEARIWGLFDRPHGGPRARGRAALLGDAARPMLPFMAQGAAMALEDAATLGRALGPDGDVPAALAAWARARTARAARVAARARANGRLFHRRSALGRLLHHAPIALVSRLAPSVAARQLDWLYGHDPAA